MAKKKNKNRSSQGRKTQTTKKKSSSKTPWIVGAVAVAAVVALIAVLSASSQSDESASASPQEQNYAGRFLPADYEGPEVAARTLYTETIAMSDVAATQKEGSVSVPLDSVIADKIVRFDYTRADAEILPMIAYVKPSGRLFVGVSYCPPCEGEGQRIETDGTLTCEACGTKRNLETNEGLSGACMLYPLDEVPSTVEGDMIVVGTPVLDSWIAQPLDRPIG